MKILFIFAIVVLCALLGYGISANYSERKKFFFELSWFIVNLKGEINFTMEKLPEVVKRLMLQIKNKSLNTLLDNYLHILNMHKDLNINELFNNIKILNDQEKDSIYSFFNRLGKLDVYNQMDFLEKSIKIFDDCYKVSQKDSEKYCPLFTKLGVLFGLFIALLVA